MKKVLLPAILAAAVLLGAACEPAPTPTCDKHGTCLIPPISIVKP